MNSPAAAVLAGVAMVLSVAASLGIAYLFQLLRKKLFVIDEKLAVHDSLSEKLNATEDQFKEMQTRLEEVEQRRTPLAEWSSEPASIHLTRRGQVLRLHRRGESSDQIASALGLSQGEVKLIIKVQELARHSSKAEKSEEEPLNVPGIFDTAYTEPRIGGRKLW